MLAGTAVFFAKAMTRGAFANPTRSFVLGDPAGGAVVYGCVLELLGADEIALGAAGPVRILVVYDEVPDLTAPIPIWSGRVVGEVRGARIVDGPV
ncbi:hypothetical protein [Catenulispora yoronensis]